MFCVDYNVALYVAETQTLSQADSDRNKQDRDKLSRLHELVDNINEQLAMLMTDRELYFNTFDFL